MKPGAQELAVPLIGAWVIHLEEVASTNDVVLQMAEEGAPEGLVVTAERQSRGRGKWGRRWESPAGGLWMSILLRPSASTSCGPVFSLMGAVASAEAIRKASGLKARVRWPNDLFLRGRKVGGVLNEMRASQRRIRYLVMGIGINVNQEKDDFSLPLRGLATSLRLESGRIWDRQVLAEALYDRVDFWYRILQGKDGNPFFLRLGQLAEGPEAEWRSLREEMGMA
ncbi:MAG: biotin--[acetyl-CoA-carboxylase] ligase [candidate division NC10 bacterium]|nr:biotin--[acetyl-CoA-carboxylase] ligase [candidate division NC10 bacterium]